MLHSKASFSTFLLWNRALSSSRDILRAANSLCLSSSCSFKLQIAAFRLLFLIAKLSLSLDTKLVDSHSNAICRFKSLMWFNLWQISSSRCLILSFCSLISLKRQALSCSFAPSTWLSPSNECFHLSNWSCKCSILSLLSLSDLTLWSILWLTLSSSFLRSSLTCLSCAKSSLSFFNPDLEAPLSPLKRS